MILIRSTLFNVAFYANTIVRLIFMLPLLFTKDSAATLRAAKAWSRSSIWLQKTIVGTHIEIEGLEKLPKDGCIIAAQHQSFWDVFAFLDDIDSPVFIFKKELLDIPLFGQYIMLAEMIPVDRSAKGTAMASVLEGARREIQQNQRQLFIFPEGTRRPVGAGLEYKFGVGRIYHDINVPIVPIALVSGLFWPRHSFLRQPGYFKARVLDPIEPGLTIEDAMKELVGKTEAAYNELLIEAVNKNPKLQLTDLVKERIEQIQNNDL